MSLSSKTLGTTLEVLCDIQATEEEIAEYLGCSVRRIERLKGDPAYAEIFTRARAQGKIALRRAQWKKALEGDTKMLIWLGKQVLGQWDSRMQGAREKPVQDPLFAVRRMLDELSDTDFRKLAEELGVELPSAEDLSGSALGDSELWTRERDLTSIPDEVFDRRAIGVAGVVEKAPRKVKQGRICVTLPER